MVFLFSRKKSVSNRLKTLIDDLYANSAFRIFFFASLPVLAAIIGFVFTYQKIDTWYAILNKPWFTPPNAVFGPVGSTLYLLMIVSAILVATHKKVNSSDAKQGFIWFTKQLALNTLWSIAFFGLENLFVGLLVILLLIASVLITMQYFYRVSKPAAYLLIPYLVWISFATLLNLGVWLLN
ncbi:TspO protein [archaeon CG10_big_fil_rev_8_21_14_0_10_43_11]|nr:MAG: TspO protein [archaeon CG10_big_fil_rev_8_21_14_0_10_43_11]